MANNNDRYVFTCDFDANQQKICPVSDAECPGGVCMFRNVLHSDSLGIIIVDYVQKKIMFLNNYVLKLLTDQAVADDYAGIQQLFSLHFAENLPLEPPATFQSLRLGTKTIGYSTRQESKRFAWIIMRDITKETRLESITEAVCVVSNLGYIFSGIRHEIGNPLNTIKMTLSVLKESLTEFSTEKVLEYIQRALTEIDRVEYLLNLLKTYNICEEPDIQQLNLKEFFKYFMSLVKEDLHKNGISLSLIQEDPQLLAAADPRALHQVLLNLLTNSTDALQETAAPQIVMRVTRENNHVVISVTDNGQGMSVERLSDLFKPFVTHKSKGTGLGLVFSRKMLAKMHGTITAASRQGEGTTMTFTLPVADTATTS